MNVSDAVDEPGRLRLLAVPTALRALPAETWAVVGLTVLAAAIRILVIDNQSYWADEALTAYEAHLPFGAMINTVRHVETTPPLYFVLVWAWAHVFGIGEIALRSISVAAGIALVPVAYLSGRELVSGRAGVFAAALISVNPFLIWYSQEARAYMLLAAFCGASFLFFARTLREPTRRNLSWWTAFSVLAVTTHFFGGFLVAAEGAWLLWRLRSRAAAMACAIVVAVHVAILPLAVADTGHGIRWLTKIPVLRRVSRTVIEWNVSLLERYGSVPIGLLIACAVIAIVVVLVRAGGDPGARRGALIAGAVAAFVFAAPLALHLIGQDYFYPRNEIPAIVPVAVVLGAACASPRPRMAGGLFAAALMAVFSAAAVFVQTHPYLQRPDWRAVAAALGPARVTRAVVAADGTSAQPLKIYLPRVDWVRSHTGRVLVGEIDIVGSQKLVTIIPKPTQHYRLRPGRLPHGRPLPMKVAPAGGVLLRRWRVENWVLARFGLHHPTWLSPHQIARLAPRYFQHTPTAMLIFFQRGAGRG